MRLPCFFYQGQGQALLLQVKFLFQGSSGGGHLLPENHILEGPLFPPTGHHGTHLISLLRQDKPLCKKLFPDFTIQAFFMSFSLHDFTSGKLPLALQGIIFLPYCNENLPIFFNKCYSCLNHIYNLMVILISE